MRAQKEELPFAEKISKKFEEIVRGTVSDVHQHFTDNAIKGEFVAVIEGK